MKEIIIFAAGAVAGGFVGFLFFCVMSINRYDK